MKLLKVIATGVLSACAALSGGQLFAKDAALDRLTSKIGSADRLIDPHSGTGFTRQIEVSRKQAGLPQFK